MIPSDCDRAMVYGCCLASFERVQDKKQERAYSLAIAVLVHQTRDIDGMLDWAWQLAKATHQGLSIFYVRVGAANKPHELEPGVDSGPEGCAIWEALSKRVAPWFEEGLADPEISRVVISQITAPAPYRVVLSELERLAPSLLIVSDLASKQNDDRTLPQKLLNRTRFPVLLYSGETMAIPEKILIPIPELDLTESSIRALRSIISSPVGQITFLAVVPRHVELGEAVGKRSLERIMQALGLAGREQVHCRVMVSDQINESVVRVALEHDLVISPISTTDTLYPHVFGPLKRGLDRSDKDIAVAGIRDGKNLIQRLMPLLDRWLNLWVPQADRAARVDVYESLQRGSTWGFDFMMLIALSTTIASFGLQQSSTAVVIGAMLVAPLMTPLLGAGLGLLQGNRKLLVAALRAVGLGFLLALGLSTVVGLFSPIHVMTAEMSSRGAPNLLDLAVGLVSGFAAAYAYSRAHLSAALPGVAIAAALVPPIATAGLCIAIGELHVGAGAILLFASNVFAIIVGATCAFYSFGLRGRDTLRTWASKLMFGLFVATLLLAIPLSHFLWELAERPATGMTAQVSTFVERAGYRLETIEKRADVVTLRVMGVARFPSKKVGILERTLSKQRGRPVRVRVITELLSLGRD